MKLVGDGFGCGEGVGWNVADGFMLCSLPSKDEYGVNSCDSSSMFHSSAFEVVDCVVLLHADGGAGCLLVLLFDAK